MTVKVKVGLSIGYPTATHEDVLEFEDGVTQAQVDYEVSEWAYSYIEYYGEVVEGELAENVAVGDISIHHQPPTKVCHWTLDDEDVYATECRHMFHIIDGTPADNNFKFCSFCGGELVVELDEESES